MKHFFTVFVFLVLCSSCDNKQKDTTKLENDKSVEKKFDMYEMSEMALLMEQMYVDNQRVKEQIKNGETLGKFPNHFLNIHTAKMTNKQKNDAFFKEKAANFIQAQKLIYEDPENAKEHFNRGVDACIKCHEVKCGGPIPKIKKLYIK